MQRLHVRTGLTLLGRGREHFGGPFEQLGAPLPDLVRVDLELLSQFNQRAVALDRSQRHFRFKAC